MTRHPKSEVNSAPSEWKPAPLLSECPTLFRATAPTYYSLAQELSERDHLVFACGRYEGIDERVIDWDVAGVRDEFEP